MRQGFRLCFATTISAFALLAFPGLARAQADQDTTCKTTETQSECHDRLKCKANEELDDCQKRLQKCKASGQTLQACEQQAAGKQQGGNGQDNHGDRDRGDRGDRDRGDRDQNGDDRNQRTDNGERDDTGDRSRRTRDRGDRDDDGGGGARRERRRRQGGHGGFEANKTFGLGIELGEPTGINGKVFVAPRGAIDFGLGYIFDPYYFGEGLHIYADYLWHPFLLAATPSFELPFYVGIGLRYWDFTYCYMGVCTYDGNAVGIRVPLGITFDFNNVPLDIFLQLTPVLDFVGGHYYTQYGDRAHFGIDGSVGIRHWFK